MTTPTDLPFSQRVDRRVSSFGGLTGVTHMVILKKLDNSTRSQKDFIMQPWAIKQSKIKLLHNVIVEQESGLI